MALPKPTRPEYTTTLPSTGKKIKYQPFSVKEEKVLILASESQDNDEIANAITNVLESSVTSPGFKVSELALFDIELLFLKARAKSVGESLEVNVTDPTDETYTTQHSIQIDKIGVTTNKDHKDLVTVTEDTHIKMGYPGIDFFVEGVNLTNISERLDLAAQCIEQIIIGDEVYNKEDMDPGEAQEWLEGLTSTQFSNVMEFFLTMPRLEHSFTLTNPNTKKKFTIKLEGLADFF
jgi:hypothetical protein